MPLYLCIDAGGTKTDCAVSNGAELLGMEGKVGTLRAGAFADIAAVEGDPLADIDAAIHKVRWVMKGGSVVVDRTKER